jgi:hypothetical protein
MLWYRYWDHIYHARFALLSDFKASICSTHNIGDILGISLNRQQRSPRNTMLCECTLCQRSTYQWNNLLVLLHRCKGICTRSCLYHEGWLGNQIGLKSLSRAWIKVQQGGHAQEPWERSSTTAELLRDCKHSRTLTMSTKLLCGALWVRKLQPVKSGNICAGKGGTYKCCCTVYCLP